MIHQEGFQSASSVNGKTSKKAWRNNTMRHAFLLSFTVLSTLHVESAAGVSKS